MKKRYLLFILFALLLTACAAKTQVVAAPTVQTPAVAAQTPAPQTQAPEETQPPAEMQGEAIPEAQAHEFTSVLLRAGESCEVDLDGDGRLEKVSLETIENAPDAEEDETIYTMRVYGADGNSDSREGETYTYDAGVLIADMDATDGKLELFFSVVYESDDYSTSCLRYENDVLHELDFEADCFGGRISSVRAVALKEENGHVTLNASVDVLGTYGAEREFMLMNDVLVPVSYSDWHINPNHELSDAELWAYRALEVKKPLPVYLTGKDTLMQLSPGVKIIITGTDAYSYADFVTVDGTTGRIMLQKPSADEWGWYIEGVPEREYFVNELPYAG